MGEQKRDLLAERLAVIPRLGLTDLPTPMEPISRLSEALGGPKLWVKREDCTGLGFGGNKLRKLDFVLREAVDAGADTVVSGGVVQSNSQRQVAAAAAAAKLGLKCHLAVYHGRLKPPTEEYESSGNAFLNRLYGALLHDVPWTGDRNEAIASLFEQLKSDGRKPYMVPYGVSNGLGAVAYSEKVIEIAKQVQELNFTPNAVVHCTGSGGTQAGLVLGAIYTLPSCRIVGIDIDAEPERVRGDVITYGHDAARLLGLEFDEDRVESRSRACRPGLWPSPGSCSGSNQAGSQAGSAAS